MLKFSSAAIKRALPILASTVLAALLAACGTGPQTVVQPQTPPPSPQRFTQDWVGTYSGTVPCSEPAASNCTAQQITLVLLPNNSYQLDTTVLRRGKPYTISSTGRLRWDATGSVVTLASKDENARLLISNGIARRLPGATDADASSYQGYVLRKR